MGRKWTDEEKKEWGEKMKRLREERQAAKPQTEYKKPNEDTVLDLTKDKNFNTEAEFVRWIHWEYDDGRMPTVIEVNSHQAVVIASFTKVVPVRGYNSPFGTHRIRIVTAKELEKRHAEEESV